MSLSAIIEALFDAGATREMIVAAVRAHEQSASVAVPGNEARSQQIKSNAARRMARYRQHRIDAGLPPVFNGKAARPHLIERDGDQCVYCASAPGSTIDHMLSVSRGGTDDIDNLALACMPCNAGKMNHLIGERGIHLKSPTAAAAYDRYVRSLRANIGEHKCEHGEHAAEFADARELGEQRASPLDPPSLLPEPLNSPPYNPPSRSSLRSEPADRPSLLPALIPASDLPAPTAKPKRAKSVKPPAAPPGEFEKWWDEYPNKVSKKEAIAAFDKAWALLSLSHAYPGDVLWNGLQNYKRKVAGWEKRHIRYAATWLNAENWNDEEHTDGHGTGPSAGRWGDQRTDNIRSFFAPAAKARGFGE